jgi:undecaprenyl-diphosphatase
VSWLAILALGLLQGVTEFLPVSSSGHLELVERLWGASEPPVLFNVSLHVGTLAAILALYGRDFVRIVAAGLRWLGRLPRAAAGKAGWRPADDVEREALGVVIATVVTGVVGLGGIAPLAEGGVGFRALGLLFVVGGLMLGATRWAPAGRAVVTPGRAVVLGLVQAVALLPGISRSGSTIAAALFLGVEREAAARFSFVLAVPAILGAEGVGLLGGLGGAPVPAAGHLAGALLAGLAGFGALWLLVRLVRRGALHWFAAYLVPLGAVVALAFG